MIWIIFVIFLISLFIKYIYELHSINYNASLIQVQDPNEITISELLNHKSPLLIYNLISKYSDLLEININTLITNNPGYIIKDNNKNISLSSFGEENVKQMYILDNENMINDFNLKPIFDTIIHIFNNNLSCNITHQLSILKGDNSLTLSQNKHNIQLFIQLSGKTNFYIFNPKHKNDIINKTNKEIKKWSIQINLKPGVLLSIPTNWYYMYEINSESILCSSYSDNYFTWPYNIFR